MNSVEPALRRRLATAFNDLLATRESRPGTLAPEASIARDFRPAGSLTSREQRSLFSEVLDWMFAPLLLLWPLSIAFTFLVARSLADAPFDRALTDHANVLARQVHFDQGRASVQGLDRLRELIGVGTEETLYFQISAADGALLAGDRGIPEPALYDFPAPGRTKLRSESFRGQEVRIAYTYVQSDIDEPGMPSAPALVQVAETLDSRNTLANEIIKGVIFPQFLILPLAVGLIWFGLSRGLVPLRDLQRRIRARRVHDLSPIDSHDTPEELTPLIQAFNELLGRLDESLGAQRRFIADAAHQMKTPLAGLRTQAELAVRETDPKELERRLRHLAISSQRSAHLIDQLLSLARTENSETQQGDSLDLAGLVRESAVEWVAPAIGKRIDFGLEADETPAWIRGQPVLLREMIANLIDNALRYTPAEGSVTVRVSSTDEHVLFEVEDSGRGIPSDERELVFERFYRVLGTDIDGSGLGLSIVREIAVQHGASVTITDGSGPNGPCGTRLTVRFAKASPA